MMQRCESATCHPHCVDAHSPDDAMLCPVSWRMRTGCGWQWLKESHGSVWETLAPERWQFIDGYAQPKQQPPVNCDASLSRVRGPSKVSASGEAGKFWDELSASTWAWAVLSKDGNELWVIAVSEGGGVAVNGESVVASRVQPMDFIQVGPDLWMVDHDDAGNWRFHEISPVRGIHVLARSVELSLKGGPILGPIDLDIPAGQFLGIAAPSGTGKTRLVRLLSRQDPPDSGDIIWAGQWDNAEQPLGYADQHDTVFTDLPVLVSLMFTGRLRGLDSNDAETEARRALQLMRLGHFCESDRLIRQLSGGERHRVSVAGELLVEHPLVILDEPTTGLDPVMSHRLIRQLHARAHRGQTIVMTTHELDLYEYCDRVIVLRRESDPTSGDRTRVMVVADGTPQQLKDATGQADLAGAIKAIYEHPPDTIRPSEITSLEPDRSIVTTGNTESVRARLRDVWTKLREQTVLVQNRLQARQKANRGKKLIVPPFERFELHVPSGETMLFWSLPVLIVAVVYLSGLRQPMMQYLIVVTTLWLAMSASILSIVAQRAVWERERHLGLRPLAYLAGCFLHHGKREVPRVLLTVLVAFSFHTFGSEAARFPSLYHGHHSVSAMDWIDWSAWLMVGGALLLIALVGTAFGLAISACTSRLMTAQQWLACILLAQILLTVQLAHDTNHQQAFTGETPEMVVHKTSKATVILWGHDLLKIVGDSARWRGHIEHEEWRLLRSGTLWLFVLFTTAMAIAWTGLWKRKYL